MAPEVIRLLPLLVVFIVLYRGMDYLHKKALKNPLKSDDKVLLRFEELDNYKLKLGKYVFLIGLFFTIFLIIYSLFN